MNVLLTKKLSPIELDLIRSWDWNVDVVETLKITPVDVNEIPSTEAWVVSSRNSVDAIKKFIDQAPASIYCVGNWMKEELIKTKTKSSIKSFVNMKSLVSDLASQNLKSILYFCGEDHRHELEEGLKNSLTKISKVFTHQSEMKFPVVSDNYDVIFIFSPRSAESLLKNNSFNNQTIFACVGSTTAAYLNNRGVANTFVASYPDSRILLEEFQNRVSTIKS